MARKLNQYNIRKANGIYADYLKAIRPFVDFDYNLNRPLGPSQKAKIKRYYDAIENIQSRSNKVFRSRVRKNVEAVQKFGRNEFDGLPGIKVAFYESPQANPTQVRIRNGRVTAKSQYFDIGFIELDSEALADDPDAVLDEALAESTAKYFRVSTGRFSIESTQTRSRIKPKVKRLMQKYDTYKDDGTRANNNYRNWLNGLIEIHAQNQNDLAEFRLREARFKKGRDKRRRKKRRADKSQTRKRSR